MYVGTILEKHQKPSENKSFEVICLENKPYYKRIVFRYTHSNSILKYLLINQNVGKMVKNISSYELLNKELSLGRMKPKMKKNYDRFQPMHHTNPMLVIPQTILLLYHCLSLIWMQNQNELLLE